MKTQLHKRYVRENITKGMKLLGDSWTLLIIGELMKGECRFNELQDRLGVAPSVLANRLDRLVSTKMIMKRSQTVNKLSVSYKLTKRGQNMDKVLFSLSEFIRNNMLTEDADTKQHLRG